MRITWMFMVLCTVVSWSVVLSEQYSAAYAKSFDEKQVKLVEGKDGKLKSTTVGRSRDVAVAMNQYEKQKRVLALKPAPKAVSIFNQCFKEEIQKCSLASAVFDIEKNITREEFQAAKTYLVTAFTADGGSKTSAKNGDSATRYMTISKGRLTSDFMTTIYSDSMGRFLYYKKVLTEKNAKKLASSYAQMAKDVAEKLLNEKYPRSKVTSLPTTYATFLAKENIFETDDLEKISRDYGLEWKYQYQIGNDPTPSKCKVPSPESKDPNPLIKECDNVCKINDKSVNEFQSVFRNEIEKSSILIDLCNPSVDAAEFSRGVDYMSQYILLSIGSKDIAILADFMSRYIRDIKNLTQDDVIDHGKFMAKYLLSQKVLNCKNAKSLAEQFARSLEKKARLVVNKKYSKSKTVAILLGVRDFLNQYKLIDASLTPKLAYYFGNEWRCIAANKCD